MLTYNKLKKKHTNLFSLYFLRMRIKHKILYGKIAIIITNNIAHTLIAFSTAKYCGITKYLNLNVFLSDVNIVVEKRAKSGQFRELKQQTWPL